MSRAGVVFNPAPEAAGSLVSLGLWLWRGEEAVMGRLLSDLGTCPHLLQDGLIHASLKPAEILYLTVAYDWFLFG